MTGFQIYIIAILDSIVKASIWMTVFSGILLVICTAGFIGSLSNSTYSEYNHIWKKLLKINCIVYIPLLIFSILIPNTKQAAAIVVLPRVLSYASENNELEKLPVNILKAANSWLESQVDVKMDSLK